MHEQAARNSPALKLLSWVMLTILIVTIGFLPNLFRISSPPNAPTILEAQFGLEGSDAEETVSLPHTWMPASPYDVVTGTYHLTFQSARPTHEPLFLFIPSARHHIEAWVNGQRAMSALDTAWSNPTSGYSFLAFIPQGSIREGDNEIMLRQSREVGWLPGRLSPVSIGPASTIMPAYKLSNLLIDQVRAMTFALHIVLTIGIATVWTARRHDPVFRWLALIAIASLLVVLTQAPGLPLGAVEHFQVTAAFSAVGLMALGMALAIIGRPRPRLLLPAVVIVPAVLLVIGLCGLVRFPIVGLLSATVALVAYLAAAGILAHDFAVRRNWNAAILAVPCALTAWFGLHDILVVTGLHDAPFLIVSYVRTMMLLAIMVILMGRLADSLNGLDNANETLRQRLAAQEAELVLLHEKERAHASELVREHERQRLMRDLHDGLSGHLVSIIALAERNPGEGEAIERAARAALDDLRLVVNSLDLSDGDLRIALAAFREKLEPQLRRLGVELGWSTEKLPEVIGITPEIALSVLRILQEAVTNAIKHGPARRIDIEGKKTDDGRAMLEVRNDGAPLPHFGKGKGKGIGNMERRARDLGGCVNLTAIDNGANLSLVLPTDLRKWSNLNRSAPQQR